MSRKEVGGKSGARDRSEVLASLRRMVARLERHSSAEQKRTRPSRIPIEDVVEGRFEGTPHGPVFVSTAEYPTAMRRGRRGPRLKDTQLSLSRPLAALAREESLAGISLADLVYFDTETTGLATTSGTYVFLAGLGYVDEALFVVEQIFLRDYAEEPAMLWLIGQRLARFRGIVTYNGRAFDVPLMQARYVTNRVFDPPIPDRHLDMLHPARRLWRARGAGCRLTELEREILGFEREGDVPGHLIPGLYFDAMHRGIVAPLKAVFYHNAQDVVSLAALAVAGACLLDGSDASSEVLGEDIYSVARLLEESGERSAVQTYRRAFEWGFRDSHVEKEAQCRLGRLHRRHGEREEALSLFSQVAENGGPFRAYALIEMAKHLEHRERAYDRAYTAAERALEAIRQMGEHAPRIPAHFKPRLNEIEYRLQRLDARRHGRPWRPGADRH